MSPLKIIGIGFLLVLLGLIVPALMVLDLLPSSFLLAFLSHAASVAGLFMGLIGTAHYSRIDRGRRG
jgi:hypothetical protein